LGTRSPWKLAPWIPVWPPPPGPKNEFFLFPCSPGPVPPGRAAGVCLFSPPEPQPPAPPHFLFPPGGPKPKRGDGHQVCFLPAPPPRHGSWRLTRNFFLSTKGNWRASPGPRARGVFCFFCFFFSPPPPTPGPPPPFPPPPGKSKQRILCSPGFFFIDRTPGFLESFRTRSQWCWPPHPPPPKSPRPPTPIPRPPQKPEALRIFSAPAQPAKPPPKLPPAFVRRPGAGLLGGPPFPGPPPPAPWRRRTPYRPRGLNEFAAPPPCWAPPLFPPPPPPPRLSKHPPGNGNLPGPTCGRDRGLFPPLPFRKNRWGNVHPVVPLFDAWGISDRRPWLVAFSFFISAAPDKGDGSLAAPRVKPGRVFFPPGLAGPRCSRRASSTTRFLFFSFRWATRGPQNFWAETGEKTPPPFPGPRPARCYDPNCRVPFGPWPAPPPAVLA